MTTETKGYFTPVRIAFWIIMTVLFSIGIYGWLFAGVTPRPRNSDRARCIINQRMLQQVVRHHQDQNHLKPGDPIDWSKYIGPGLLLEKSASCPVHGDYPLSPVIPQPGTLAAPCKDPEHHPGDIRDW